VRLYRKSFLYMFARLQRLIFRRRRTLTCQKPASLSDRLESALNLKQEILSSAAEGIVLYDRDLRYCAWNPFMEALTGVPASRVLGQKALALFPHLVEQGVDKLLARALAGETVHSPDISYNRVHKTGRESWISAIYTPHRNIQGQVVGVFGFIRDITYRRQMEKSLRESEARFRTLVQHIPQNVFIKDRDLRYTLVNESFARQLGKPVEQILGQEDTTLFSQKTADKFRSEDRRMLETGETLELTDFSEAKGRQIWTYTIKMPVRDEQGNTTGIFGMFWDVTSRKLTEDRERLARAILDRLNSPEDAAHMIRDILQLIRSAMSVDAVGIRLRDGDDFPYR